MPITVYFISFVGRNYSRSSTILNFESSILTKKYFQTSPGFWGSLKNIFKSRQILRQSSIIVVMSPCHILVPIIKFLIRKPVILDAGWALTDGELSRGATGKRLLKMPLVYITDILSFKFADVILVETREQISRIHRLFKVQKSKLRVSLTGLDETEFCFSKEPRPLPEELSRNSNFINANLIILFRGKINRESGIERILEAALKSKPDIFYIFAIGSKDEIRNIPHNAAVLQNLSIETLKNIYQISDVCIGQFSTHPRLKYTIPHKAFESAYFGKPYITSSSPGIKELLCISDAVFIQEPTPDTLVNAIEILRDSKIRASLSSNIQKTYQNTATQLLINRNFEKIVQEISNH
jgi:glycosyltransferase involved in cell wall biosynthesis